MTYVLALLDVDTLDSADSPQTELADGLKVTNNTIQKRTKKLVKKDNHAENGINKESYQTSNLPCGPSSQHGFAFQTRHRLPRRQTCPWQPPPPSPQQLHPR